MIKRREFISGVLGLGLMAKPGLAWPAFKLRDDLEWACQVVQTPSASLKRRAPVVTGVAIAPDESQLAIVGDDHLVGIYDLASKRFRASLEAHQDWVRSVAFSPDLTCLVTAGNDRNIYCWNPSTWEQPLQLAQHPHAIFGLAYSPRADLLATVGFSSTLYLYEMAQRQELRRLECPCEDMRAVAFSQDGGFVAAGGRCGTVRVWDLASGKIAGEYRVHRQRIRSLQYNGVGQILSCGDDQVVALTDPLQPQGSIQLPRQSAKLFAVTLLDDKMCATSGSDNQISIWNLASRELIGTLKGHTGTVSCLAASPRLLVSGSYDTQIRIWQRTAKVGLLNAEPAGDEPAWNEKIR